MASDRQSRHTPVNSAHRIRQYKPATCSGPLWLGRISDPLMQPLRGSLNLSPISEGVGLYHQPTRVGRRFGSPIAWEPTPSRDSL